ncbi:MAG: S8 family serine peptidase [Gemmatimonadetes bacterium]|nr:S8 family serine peptidase [Gemmatimonadota bacterium]
MTGHGRAPVRVAVIDSGIAAGHPHVGRVVGGTALVGEDPSAWQDRLGHGTAVAGAISDLAPGVELLSVRVFDTTLATTARLLCQAIDWAADQGADLINLSVGTTNEAHRPLFEAAVSRARERGAWVVAAAMDRSVGLLPGMLNGVVGVVADPSCPRGEVRQVMGTVGVQLGASPRPRPIPGVPPERNLSGVSFAVANATGVLAAMRGSAHPIDLAVWPGDR